jgi:hypothetical protein
VPQGPAGLGGWAPQGPLVGGERLVAHPRDPLKQWDECFGHQVENKLSTHALARGNGVGESALVIGGAANAVWKRLWLSD